jgi:transcription antitermination factor NusG
MFNAERDDLMAIFSDSSQNNSERWYAIRVQSKFESVASEVLLGKGYETFLPLYKSVRRWSDRKKTLQMPLFPGYLFCRFNPTDRMLPIITTPGVMGVVSAGRTPLSVEEQEIEGLQLMLSSGMDPEPWPYLNCGAKVLIERGPLAGLEGFVVQNLNRWRVVVSVELLQRSVAAEIDCAWVRELRTQAMPEPVIALADRRTQYASARAY